MPRHTLMEARAPIVVDSVSRRFDDTVVIDDLDLTVADGSVHGLIGPSGSGKTTTVRMMTGILAPSEGTVRLWGTDPRLLDTAQRQRIGYMPQLGVLYPELSIRDNLKFVASLYSLRKADGRIDEVLDALDMGGTQSLRLENASGGMQRRVALAAALLHNPTLLFLDEPTSGLDPVLRREVWGRLQELSRQGCTVFVTTQIVSEAAMCDQVGLLADGNLLANGPPDQLRHQADGGDVVDVHAANPVDSAGLRALQDHPLVRNVEPIGRDGLTVRLIVDDADEAIDKLGPYLSRHGVDMKMAERFQAPFDDVFVSLLESSDG